MARTKFRSRKPFMGRRKQKRRKEVVLQPEDTKLSASEKNAGVCC